MMQKDINAERWQIGSSSLPHDMLASLDGEPGHNSWLDHPPKMGRSFISKVGLKTALVLSTLGLGLFRGLRSGDLRPAAELPYYLPLERPALHPRPPGELGIGYLRLGL